MHTQTHDNPNQQMADLSNRVERQYEAIVELTAMASHQNLVIASVLECYEDKATSGSNDPDIPAGVMKILRDQASQADARLEKVSAILKPDHDARVKRMLSRMFSTALSNIRPEPVQS